MHHVFQIPVAFLDMEDSGETLTYENMVAPPPEHLRCSADIAEFGESVRTRFTDWWQATQARDMDFEQRVPTYFGRYQPSRDVGTHGVAFDTTCAPGSVVAGTS